jgi:hypothetical protein
LAAEQAYRSAVQNAQGAYDVAVASAWGDHADTTSDAIAAYQAIVAAANSTYVAAIAAARQQFTANLAAFQGDTTSYEWKEFAWPQLPIVFAAIIPPDSEQPLAPMDGPNYSGGGYLFDLDPAIAGDQAAAEQAFLAAARIALQTFETARKLIQETLDADRQLAGAEYTIDIAAADAAYRLALQSGVNPVDLAAESQLDRQRRDAAQGRYDRAVDRLAKESIAKHYELQLVLSQAIAVAD